MQRDAAALSVLLVPPDVEAHLGNGGAELVVERDEDGSIRRCHIHILDEEERRDALQQQQQQAQHDDDDDDAHARLAALHTNYLQELRWARAALWADERLQRYLPCASPALWPSNDAVARVVDVVRQLKMCVDVPADVRGAERLARALALLQREGRYAGLHTLKPAPVAGTLTAYQSQSLRRQQHEQQHEQQQGRRHAAAVGSVSSSSSLMRRAVKTQRHVTALRVTPSALLMDDVNNTPLMVSDVLRLAMTQRAQTTLVQLLLGTNAAAAPAPLSSSAAAPSDVARRWQQLLQQHRTQLRSGGRGLVCGVQEAVAMLSMTERALAAHMERAANDGRCVRLRSGVYATVLYCDELYVLLDDGGDDGDDNSGSTARAALSSSARTSTRSATAAAFARVTRRGLAACVEDGRVHVVRAAAPRRDANNNDDDNVVARVLRDAFVSPALVVQCAADGDSDSDGGSSSGNNSDGATRRDAAVRRWCVVAPAQPLDARARVVHVRVAAPRHSDNDSDGSGDETAVHNCFVVLHGVRVEGGFVGDEAVYALLKRQRDEAAAEQTERALLQLTRNSGKTSAAAASARGHEGDEADDDDDDDDGRGGGGQGAHTALSSSTMTGEEVRDGVARAVLTALATAPLSRAELLRHSALQPWLRVADMDALLRTTLRTHAEYRGRKYHLR